MRVWWRAGYIGDLAAKRFPNVARPAIIQLSLVLAAPVRARLAPQTLQHPLAGVSCSVLGAAQWHPWVAGAMFVHASKLCCRQHKSLCGKKTQCP